MMIDANADECPNAKCNAFCPTNHALNAVLPTPLHPMQYLISPTQDVQANMQSENIYNQTDPMLSISVLHKRCLRVIPHCTRSYAVGLPLSTILALLLRVTCRLRLIKTCSVSLRGRLLLLRIPHITHD